MSPKRLTTPISKTKPIAVWAVSSAPRTPVRAAGSLGDVFGGDGAPAGAGWAGVTAMGAPFTRKRASRMVGGQGVRSAFARRDRAAPNFWGANGINMYRQ